MLVNYYWPGNVRELQNAAAYYNVIGSISPLPHHLVSHLPSNNYIKEKILEILSHYSEIGLGRGRLLSLLSSEGVKVSEKRFEALVKELSKEGLIVRGKGRSGMRLSHPTPVIKNSETHSPLK